MAKCVVCSRVFESPIVTSEKRTSKRKTCSRKCADTLRVPPTPVESAQCAICSQQFERKAYRNPDRRSKTCSNHCATILRFGNRKPSINSPEEIELVKSLLGIHRLPGILKILNAENQKNGRATQTMAALKFLVYEKLQASAQTVYDNLKIVDLARTLGVNKNVVGNWVKNHGLPCKHLGCRNTSIKLHAFGDWAKDHPKQLANVDLDALSWVLEKHPYKNLILTLAKQQRRVDLTPKSVVCAQTGIKYPTITAAAAAAFTTRHSLSRYIKAGKPFDGKHYLFVEKKHG